MSTICPAKVDEVFCLSRTLKHYAIPLYSCSIAAGFPSPADEFLEGKLDLNQHLINNPLATYFVRVSGESMLGAGIHPGDLLIVDRSIEARDGKIVIAVVNGELLVKRLKIEGTQPCLVAEHPDYPELKITEAMDFQIWGVVTNVIARVETIEEKPSFRNGFKKRPCLIPVSGFYEWQNKKPYYFHTEQKLFARLAKYPQRGEPPQRIFALAGIWETWSNPETEEKLFSCTILTTEAKGAIAEIHHRMPVIITSEYYDLWLAKVDGRKELIESLPEVELQLYPVSKMVNSTKNDSPDCIAPIL